jgi:hypothetical protein
MVIIFSRKKNCDLFYNGGPATSELRSVSRDTCALHKLN